MCGSRSLGLDDSTGWDGSAAEKRMRTKATGSDDKVNWSEYGKGFVYCDPSKKEEFGGYKLPFADVVGGTLKAVWGGVHSAFAACIGARTNINMSDQDKVRCISFLKMYYKRFNKPIPGEND